MKSMLTVLLLSLHDTFRIIPRAKDLFKPRSSDTVPAHRLGNLEGQAIPVDFDSFPGG